MTTAYAWDKGYPVFPVLIATMFLGFPLPLLLVALVPDKLKTER